MTDRFQFRFQKILDYRETIKKQKTEELAGCIKAFEEEKEQLNETEEKNKDATLIEGKKYRLHGLSP